MILGVPEMLRWRATPDRPRRYRVRPLHDAPNDPRDAPRPQTNRCGRPRFTTGATDIALAISKTTMPITAREARRGCNRYDTSRGLAISSGESAMRIATQHRAGFPFICPDRCACPPPCQTPALTRLAALGRPAIQRSHRSTKNRFRERLTDTPSAVGSAEGAIH